ncbi:hypothetical protein A2692_04615 [Candidatus Woesebacteria bacterium RIFCSPHIGHO2_01_FULL_39_95]|nr:MAG: hypothetical protein A2692_04615 [Candidatus Woesebacteria bacterium RIFCSPHIGHO2_01_FULL_39_95]
MKLRKLVMIFILSLLILTVFILSEVIYLVNNRPSAFSIFYIRFSKHYALKNDITSSLKLLTHAAYLGIIDQSQEYPEHINNNFRPEIVLDKNNEELNRDIITYIKNLNIPSTRNTDVLVFTSKIFYYLALISYNNNDYNNAEKFLALSAYLTPENSPSHVELSNLYLIQGKYDSARSAIYFCLNFELPYAPCDYFVKNNFEKGKTEPVGFKKEDVDKTYK